MVRIFVFFAFFFSQASGQQRYSELKIGDTIPKFDFELFNYSSSHASISDFEGKYLLLDFWATWCTSCIYKFPNLDSLQRRFKNEGLQVLLVNTKATSDSKEKIYTFFEKRRAPSGKKYSLPSIVNDTITDILFPHRMVPHYVLIDNKGIVQAITSSNQITEANIQKFVNGDKLNLTVKKDIDYDPSQPLFVSDGKERKDLYKFGSILTGYVGGFGSSNGLIVDSASNLINRLYITNSSILMMYRKAYPEMYKFPPNRFILKVANPLKYDKHGDWSDWQIDNTYCYELITPSSTQSQIEKYFRADLNRYFGLKPKIEKRKVSCLILKYTPINSQLNPSAINSVSETNLYNKDTDPKYLRNYPIKELVAFLNTYLDTPVIDETGLTQRVTLELPSNPLDVKLLTEALKKYGILIMNENRDMDYYVLSE